MPSPKVIALSSLTPEKYDYIHLAYNADGDIQTVTYKSGGASGTTIATLYLAYDSDKNLQTVTRS